MKKSFHRDNLNDSGPVHARSRGAGGSKGPWEFTSSGRLFSVGARDDVGRTAYRAADGKMRFLPV